MESIFLEAIDGGHYVLDKLERLVNSQTSVFDVLSEFFFHGSPLVERAALEVYVRRAYVAYVLSSIENLEIESGLPVLVFQYYTPRHLFEQESVFKTHESTPSSISRSSSETSLCSTTSAETAQRDGEAMMVHRASVDADSTDDSPLVRTGIISAFRSLEHFTEHLPRMLELYVEQNVMKKVFVIEGMEARERSQAELVISNSTSQH